VCFERVTFRSERERGTLSKRQSTLVCAFDPQSPRITACDIHEWIYGTISLQENEVAMVQIDGPRRYVYIKFRDYPRTQEILRSSKGQGEFRHTNGEISRVLREAAGSGLRRVRIANLPPEVPDRAIRMALGRYGEVKGVQGENWSRAYRYAVANGIRVAVVTLTKHIPLHIVVAGHRILISYEGQPTTCYGCKETGHLYQTCPRRRRVRESANAAIPTSWAEAAARGTENRIPTQRTWKWG
jgi:hypothetical protein